MKRSALRQLAVWKTSTAAETSASFFSLPVGPTSWIQDPLADLLCTASHTQRLRAPSAGLCPARGFGVLSTASLIALRQPAGKSLGLRSPERTCGSSRKPADCAPPASVAIESAGTLRTGTTEVRRCDSERRRQASCDTPISRPPASCRWWPCSMVSRRWKSAWWAAKACSALNWHSGRRPRTFARDRPRRRIVVAF